MMGLRIIYGLVLLLIISTGTVSAQTSAITLQTDSEQYRQGDTIVISGKVVAIVGDTPAILQVFVKGNLIEAAQLTVAQDGSFSHTIVADGPLWGKQGDYTVRVSYGEGNSNEVEFTYSSRSDPIKVTENFEVDAGSHGTFDVEYTIAGGTVRDMVVDSEKFALNVQIDATDWGTITLDLPRKFIDAERQDGKDDTFIIVINDENIPYTESVQSDSRKLTINFQPEDSEITIIGTHIVPEFGLVMMILVVGIMITILMTRNKFQISNL